jgi:raffinose/stachyose/melibiose transport system substrate-binding protein
MISLLPDQQQRSHRRFTTRRRRRGTLALIAAAATALSVTACASSGASAGSAGPTSGHITLVVQSGDGGTPGLLNGYAALNKAFEASHPGVTIKFEVKSFSDLVNTLKLELSGSNPPDVTQVNQGYGSMGELVTDHLLLNLDSYAAKYGWTSRQSPTLTALNGRFSANGETFGTGSLYGMAATGAWIGLFENTEIAHQLGITTAPTTLAGLEHDLATAKAHGVIPLQFGGSDGNQSSWLLASLINALDSPQLVFDVVNAKAGLTLTSPQFARVADTIKEWADKGYFTPGWAAYNDPNVFTQFIHGSGLFELDGSWNVPLPSPANPANFTMIPFPSVGGPAAPAAIATGDMAWSIPTGSKHQALAAEYINFLTSAQSATTWISTGNVPDTLPANLHAAITATHLSGPSADALLGWQRILAKGTAVPYIDWATPTFLNTIMSTVSELAANKITPSAFTAALQADYGPFSSSRQQRNG